MRKSIAWIAAPAALASVLLLTASGFEPADAKQKTQTCAQRLNACDERCRVRYIKKKNGWDQYVSCNQRTCQPQYRNCQKAEGASTAGTKDTGGKSDPKTGPYVRPGGKNVQTNPQPLKGGMPAPRGGTFQQSAPQSSGGSRPILKSGGGKR